MARKRASKTQLIGIVYHDVQGFENDLVYAFEMGKFFAWAKKGVPSHELYSQEYKGAIAQLSSTVLQNYLIWSTYDTPSRSKNKSLMKVSELDKMLELVEMSPKMSIVCYSNTALAAVNIGSPSFLEATHPDGTTYRFYNSYYATFRMDSDDMTIIDWHTDNAIDTYLNIFSVAENVKVSSDGTAYVVKMNPDVIMDVIDITPEVWKEETKNMDLQSRLAKEDGVYIPITVMEMGEDEVPRNLSEKDRKDPRFPLALIASLFYHKGFCMPDDSIGDALVEELDRPVRVMIPKTY